jgi:hypothetical protein
LWNSSSASKDARLRLRPGTVVHDHVNGCSYRVLELLGRGGCGAAYKVVELRGNEYRESANLFCLKVAVKPHAWHHEAYFGDLLRRVEGVLSVHASFAWTHPLIEGVLSANACVC